MPEASVTQLAGTRLDHILNEGVLQVGYRPNNLPCSFLTAAGELVGFDVEMAHILAEDLDVELQFVPFEFDQLGSMLASGQIDMAMSCIASLPDRYAYASFSRPYLDLSLAFIVRDHERDLFGDLELCESAKTDHRHGQHPLLRAAAFDACCPMRSLSTWRPQRISSTVETRAPTPCCSLPKRVRPTPIATPVMRWPGSRGGGIRLPAAYAVPKGDVEMMEFVSNWIELKRKDGTIDGLYDYWMLGGAAKVEAAALVGNPQCAGLGGLVWQMASSRR